jgi:hypothetical protein
MLLTVKEATGFGLTVTVLVMLLVHPAAVVTVRVTLYVPPVAYVCEGFCKVLLVASPKFQLQDGVLPLTTVELLVKVIGAVAQAVVAVKSAMGAGCMLTATVVVVEQPSAEVAVKVTL